MGSGPGRAGAHGIWERPQREGHSCYPVRAAQVPRSKSRILEGMPRVLEGRARAHGNWEQHKIRRLRCLCEHTARGQRG